MSRTIGPVLATGAMTVANRTVFNSQPMDWRIPIATGFAAVGFSLFERVAPEIAVILAWTSFLTVLLTGVDKSVPSPVQSALTWWKEGK